MNWDAIGAVGEIVGAAGVIISILYLSQQIRRSDATARAEAVRAVLDGPRDRLLVPGYTTPDLAYLFANGTADLNSLDANEQQRFFWLMYEQLIQMQQVHDLHVRGLLEKHDYDAWMYYTCTLLKTPGGETIWPSIKATITPRIKDALEKHLADNPDIPSYLDVTPVFAQRSPPNKAMERPR